MFGNVQHGTGSADSGPIEWLLCFRGVRLSLKLGYEEWVQIGKSRYNINPSTTPLGKSRECPRARALC